MLWKYVRKETNFDCGIKKVYQRKGIKFTPKAQIRLILMKTREENVPTIYLLGFGT